MAYSNRYSRDFFAIQVQYAQKLADKFGRALEDILFDYTTLTRSFDLIAAPYDQTNPVWQEYLAGLKQAVNLTDYTYNFYLSHKERDIFPTDETFHGHLLFGCFYFSVRANHVIRPHFIKNDPSKYGLLSKDRMSVRLKELKRMFGYIKENVDSAEIVEGHSWLYNTEAYRRLFPPEYTKSMGEGETEEFQFLARWGQFFDRNWKVKAHIAQEFFNRLEQLEALEDLHNCFPYYALKPRCHIKYFYEFYGIH